MRSTTTPSGPAGDVEEPVPHRIPPNIRQRTDHTSRFGIARACAMMRAPVMRPGAGGSGDANFLGGLPGRGRPDMLGRPDMRSRLSALQSAVVADRVGRRVRAV